MGFKEEAGSGDGGTDDTGERAELELHDGAVTEGEGVDGAVREGTDEVEVADDWPGFGARGEIEVAMTAGGFDEEENGGEEN